MTKPFYFARNDVMFKRIFGDARNTVHLVNFLRAVLDLPPEDYAEVTIANPFLAREHPDDKLGILDIKLKTATGKIIDIEIQLCDHAAIRERVVFYLSKMVTEQIGEGSSYWDIRRSVCIFITDFHLAPKDAPYHNTYRLRDKSGEDFSDRIEVILLELPKLPQETDGSALWDWLRFIAARTLEELKMLAEKNPEVKNAVNRLMELNADEQARMEAESRERLRLDIGSYKRDAMNSGLAKGLEQGRAEGRAEGLEEGQIKGRAEGLSEANHAIARKLLERGWSADEVAATTTLSRDEVLSLAH